MSGRELFTSGHHHPDGPIRCEACGRHFRRWRGLANHGLAHERRGEATAASDPHCPPTSGHRYVFYLVEHPA